MSKDQNRHRRFNSTVAEQAPYTFDTAGSHTKWLRDLHGAQMKHIPLMNQRTNPDLQLHSTEPVNRFERNFKMRDIGFTSRSGFNVAYDSASHRKPVWNTNKNSLKKLVAFTAKAAN